MSLTTSPNYGASQAMKACGCPPAGLFSRRFDLTGRQVCWGRKDAVVSSLLGRLSGQNRAMYRNALLLLALLAGLFTWGSERVLQGWILPWPTGCGFRPRG